MERCGHGQVTELLAAWNRGEQDALAKLTPLVYDELHRLARRYMRGERRQQTLETTALINEAYLKLVDARRVRWRDRAHFLAVAAELMRRILVDFARARRSQKRGGERVRVTFSEDVHAGCGRHLDVIAVHEALEDLARLDPRKAKVVELRFFGGLSGEEAAEALGVSTDTLGRDWIAAKAWLLRELRRKV
jgi:RNA polymerase sigma factor (TIGR02999 family)